jgi:hypothetical protein
MYKRNRYAIIIGFLEGDREKMENAIKRLTEGEVREIVNKKYKFLWENTMLYLAVENEDVEMVRLLLRKGAMPLLGAIETPYALAKRKGGELFTLFEPRLKGMILNVGLCSICDQTLVLYTLECGHTFCYDCCQEWTKECISQIHPTPLCPQLHCRQPISHLQPLLHPHEIESYHKKLFRSSLISLPHFYWCPNCPYGFFLDESSCSHNTSPYSTLTCPQCKYHWCRKCQALIHSNLNCDEAFCLLSKEEQEYRNWKTINTKPCPVCKTAIEKNNGCNHMSCTQCKYEFCWLCLSKYNPEEPCC